VRRRAGSAPLAQGPPIRDGAPITERAATDHRSKRQRLAEHVVDRSRKPRPSTRVSMVFGMAAISSERYPARPEEAAERGVSSARRAVGLRSPPTDGSPAARWLLPG
jgi:hypothetical protein